MKSLSRSAEWYARHGWYVVPLHQPLFHDGHLIGCSCETWRRQYVADYVCPTPGKHPRISDWENQATRELGIVRQWWTRWPNANVGIAAGRSGLLALDADTYKDGYEGEHLLSREDEETVTNLTGSGGTHLVYQMPEGALYTNAKGTLPKGIDIRGWGGQFVVPPSLHPSGRLYEWETGYGPHEIAVRPLPDLLRQILDEAQLRPNGAVAFGPELGKPDLDQWLLSQRTLVSILTVPEKGKRSETDQSVITALVLAGATDDEIRAVFVHYPIGTDGKFAEKGANALRYLAHSIAHARGWIFDRHQERAAAFMARAAA